jgi:hypothetical protein
MCDEAYAARRTGCSASEMAKLPSVQDGLEPPLHVRDPF